jgi:hypothetical protein
VVPPCSDRVSRAPPYSRIFKSSTPTGLSPTTAGLSRPFSFSLKNHWPDPLSLATTSGISVDVFSSGYLDVSVPRVRLQLLCIQNWIPSKGWVSPFGHPRINDRSHLPAAFRSVPRPSSPLSAKASTERPYLTSYPHHRPRTGPNHAQCKLLTNSSASHHINARSNPLTLVMRHNTTIHLHHEKEQQPSASTTTLSIGPQHIAKTVFLEAGKADHQQTSTIPHGDGRIRTDDPLLAKQVLSH